MRKILLILIILICIGGIVGAAYTYNKYSESITNDDTGEPTEQPTEDPSTCKHTKEVVLPAVEATCYKNGYTEGRMCSACGTMLIEQEIINKLTHTPEIIPSEESTCTVQGHTSGSKCSVCHEVLVLPEELPLADHNPITISATPSTCLTQGTSTYIMCYDCFEPITEPTLLPLEDCDKSVYVEEVESTCTVEGHAAFYACSYCGRSESPIEYYPLAEHELLETAVGFPATCTMVGYSSEYTCCICEDVIISMMEIPMLEHDWTWIEGKLSTCTEEGYTDSCICSMCGEYDYYPEPLPYAEHTLVTLPAEPATCTSTGLTEGKRCSVCNTVTVQQQTINKVAHNYVSMETVVADCYTQGRVGGTECSVCGTVGTVPTYSPSLGHYYGDNFTAKCDRCQAYYVNANTLGFTLNDIGNYTVTSIGTCDHETIIIPDTYNNRNITEIMNGAIQSEYVETILVGSEIKILNSGAIKNCPNLKAVFIPANVTRVGYSIFSNCPNLTDIYLEFKEGFLPEAWESLWSVGIPEGCTIHYMPADAVLYGFNYKLNSSKDGYIVTGLAYDDSQDHIFHIPAKYNGLPVTEIAANAFKNKRTMYEVYVPNSVITIGESAFEWCYDLKKVIFYGDVELGNRAFACCEKLQTVNTVKATKMGDYCFLMTGLSVVETSPNLKVIPKGAFDECINLTSVYINEGTTKILDHAFIRCSALVNVYLPDGLEHISYGAFTHCNSLTSIYIPESVTIMGVTESGMGTGNVFYTTSGDLVINCGADSQPTGWYEGWNASDFDPDTDEILAYYTTNWGQER